MHAPDTVSALTAALEDAWGPLSNLGRAWARVMPSVVLIPAFGLRALARPMRAAVAFWLCLALLPLMGDAESPSHEAWPIVLAREVMRGMPIAISAALTLWGAMMAGGVVDALRASSHRVAHPILPGQPTLFGVLFGTLATVIFLRAGGAAHVVHALGAPVVEASTWLRVARELALGIELAVAVAAPTIVAAVVIEVGLALVARAASPAQVLALVAPLRTVAVLGAAAIALQAMVAAVTDVVSSF